MVRYPAFLDLLVCMYGTVDHPHIAANMVGIAKTKSCRKLLPRAKFRSASFEAPLLVVSSCVILKMSKSLSIILSVRGAISRLTQSHPTQNWTNPDYFQMLNSVLML